MKRMASFALAAALLLTVVLVPQWGAKAAEPIELYLYVGSPIALSEGKIHALDQENPDLAPVIYKDRTLVPLRFVSEFFGAQVNYDAGIKAGIVTVNGKTAQFPVGESYYLLDGERVELDTETLNLSGRIFLPLRALCEQVLELPVEYKDSVIGIADGAALTDAQVSTVKDKIGMYVKVTSLAALRENLALGEKNRDYYGDVANTEPQASAEEAPTASPGQSEGSANEAAAPAEAASDVGGGSDDHSTTNTQVEGVDEADVIKTDGRYIYLLGDNTVKIVQAGETMSLAAQFALEGDCYGQDMYVDGNRLVVIGTRYAEKSRYLMEDAVADVARAWPSYGKEVTFVQVYDISDTADITLFRQFDIEGYLSTTRKQGDYIYLLSSMSVWNLDDADPRPLVGEDGALSAMPVDDMMIMPGMPAESYLTLSAINIRDLAEPVESETISGSGYVSYMSNNALYVAMYSGYYYSSGRGDTLHIAKFSINGSAIGYAGSGTVAGYLNNQFSMDEHNGYLRLATTTWEDNYSNQLYVLDENMEVCGSVQDYAPGETIYSVRFMGDTGYVVTFKQIDPLFVFDLSDPENPAITGELKVPGFSSYLHPVSEDVILGIGYDVQDVYVKDKNGKEVVISQQTGGIKLSLFDVSDMGKPKEIDTLIIGDSGYAEVLYNHKAAMFKAGESLLAFPASVYDYSWKSNDDRYWDGALLISYQNNELREFGRIARGDADRGNDYFYMADRLVYIGDTLYYAQTNLIRSFDLDTLKELDSLRLN